MPLEGMVTGIGDPLHAIYGMPLAKAAVPSLRGWSRPEHNCPLGTAVVPWCPCFMPQTCPSASEQQRNVRRVPSGTRAPQRLHVPAAAEGDLVVGPVGVPIPKE